MQQATFNKNSVRNMPALRSRQTGLGALGWLIVLGIAAFGLTCFFKVGPVYLEYWQTKQALDDVLANGQNAGKSKPELLDSIQKHLDVSRIETVNAKDIRFTQTRNGLEVDASYEKRVALIANIDVVVKFDKLKYTISGPQ
jgi:hypothetical protein